MCRSSARSGASPVCRTRERKPRMKGPNIRHALDVRRTWVCPKCGRRRLAPGQETQQTCRCAGNGPVVWMRLEEPMRTARPLMTFAAPQTETADEAEARMGPDPNPRPVEPPPTAPPGDSANTVDGTSSQSLVTDDPAAPQPAANPVGASSETAASDPAPRERRAAAEEPRDRSSGTANEDHGHRRRTDPTKEGRRASRNKAVPVSKPRHPMRPPRRYGAGVVGKRVAAVPPVNPVPPLNRPRIRSRRRRVWRRFVRSGLGRCVDANAPGGEEALTGSRGWIRTRLHARRKSPHRTAPPLAFQI